MNDTLNLRVFLEDTFEGLKVTTVHLFEGGLNTCDLRDTVEHIDIRVREVVDDHHLIAGLLQLHSGMASDKARATSD